MIKINENKDLSKQVLEINIDSPIFNCLRQDLNEEIQRCIQQVYDESFEAGEISLKLTIELLNDYKSIPRVDESGQTVEDTFRYRRPNFEHKITTTLKKRFKQEGVFTGEREVIFEDGEYKAVPLKDPQISIDDLDTEIKLITQDEASKIINTYEPIGLFMVDNITSFTGIDNSDGEAWTEDFNNREDCIAWLHGEDKEDDTKDDNE